MVERLYGHFGFAAGAALAPMQQYNQARAEPAAGEHRYDLERYGLCAAEIQERFQAYTLRFADHLQP